MAFCWSLHALIQFPSRSFSPEFKGAKKRSSKIVHNNNNNNVQVSTKTESTCSRGRATGTGKDRAKWDVNDSAQLYRIECWGAPYFSINSHGNVCVRPWGTSDGSDEIDIMDLIESLQRSNVKLPMVIRFPDIVLHRIQKLQQCFDMAIARYGYQCLTVYRDGIGVFSFADAIRDRTEFMPATWRRTYGVRTPNLRKFAIRILSQTCTASGCEGNWSVFEKIHVKRRRRLEFTRLNDLVYVHYNLRLWTAQILKEPDANAISLDNIDILSNWRVEIETPIMEEAPAWLEEGQVEEEEEVVGGTMEGDVLASPPPSAPLDISSPPSITQRRVLDAGSGPSTATSSARGRPDKRPMIFSRKRGRGH